MWLGLCVIIQFRHVRKSGVQSFAKGRSDGKVDSAEDHSLVVKLVESQVGAGSCQQLARCRCWRRWLQRLRRWHRQTRPGRVLGPLPCSSCSGPCPLLSISGRSISTFLLLRPLLSQPLVSPADCTVLATLALLQPPFGVACRLLPAAELTQMKAMQLASESTFQCNVM